MDNFDDLYGWWIREYGSHIVFELNIDLVRRNRFYGESSSIEIALFMLDQTHTTIYQNGLIRESGILTVLMGIDFFKLLKNLTAFIENYLKSNDMGNMPGGGNDNE